MTKKVWKFVAFLFAVIFVTVPFSHAFALQPAPEVASEEAILYNIDSEELLFEKNADDTIYPASFTKLMTALLGFEYYKKNPDSTVLVQKEIINNVGGTTMGLKSGETVPFGSLLQGLVIANANDAALEIAVTVGGSVSAFVEMMNARAKALGMENTYYGNPTGIDAAVMHTTLRDTLKLCLAIYRINDFMVMSSEDYTDIPATDKAGKRRIANKNLIISYSYVLDYYLKNSRGMIAGFTGEAGHCIATTYEGADGVMLCIISGGKDTSVKQNGSAITAYYDAKNLIKWGDDAFDLLRIAEKDEIVCEKKVLLGNGLDHVLLAVGANVDVIVDADLAKNKDAIKKEVSVSSDTFTAPVIKGEKYGEIVYSYDGKEIARADLVALSNVGKSVFLTVASAITGFFSGGAPLAVLIAVCAGFVIYIIVLLVMVWINSVRRNRPKKEAMARIREEEEERLKVVVEKERDARRKRKKKILRSVREVYKAFTGEEGDHDYVAKVPEKYRKTAKPATPTGETAPLRNPAKKPAPAPAKRHASPGKNTASATRKKAPAPTDKGHNKS